MGFQKPGTTFDFNHFILIGMEIQGVYGREMYETWQKMMAMISTVADKVILDWTQAGT